MPSMSSIRLCGVNRTAWFSISVRKCGGRFCHSSDPGNMGGVRMRKQHTPHPEQVMSAIVNFQFCIPSHAVNNLVVDGFFD